jgi:hypothetical protein
LRRSTAAGAGEWTRSSLDSPYFPAIVPADRQKWLVAVVIIISGWSQLSAFFHSRFF